MNWNLLRRVLGSALILAGVFAIPIQAQPLPPNTRVRVATASTRSIGTVVRSTPDSLFTIANSGQPMATDWKNVSRLEYSAGKRGHAGRGALIGAGTMTLLTVATLVFNNSEDEYGEDLTDMIVILAIPLNAAVGAGVGALIGLAWRTERWVAVPSYSPQGGSSLGLTYKF